MSSGEKHVLCAGIAVLDYVFRVQTLPRAEVKTQASDFRMISGGNAANGAVAIAHLGARVSFAGPFGPAGADPIGDRIIAGLEQEGIDCAGSRRLVDAQSSLSAISIDARGERAIVNYRDDKLAAARPENPDRLVAQADAILADNRFPEFVLPICEAARKRGIPSVLDADEPRRDSHDLLNVVSHVVFSAEGLRATAGNDNLGRALVDMARRTASFLAVTDGRNDVLWLDGKDLRSFPAFRVEVVDTLGAGDTFHGAFALMLAEGKREPEAIRFAAAAAGLKCSRYGGVLGAPTRAEVEAFLAKNE